MKKGSTSQMGELIEEKKVSSDLIEKAGGVERLRRVKLPLNDEGTEHLEIVCAVPSRRVFAQFQKYQNVNPSRAMDILIKNCALTDLDQILADDDLFLTAYYAIIELLPIRESIIKKY